MSPATAHYSLYTIPEMPYVDSSMWWHCGTSKLCAMQMAHQHWCRKLTMQQLLPPYTLERGSVLFYDSQTDLFSPTGNSHISNPSTLLVNELIQFPSFSLELLLALHREKNWSRYAHLLISVKTLSLYQWKIREFKWSKSVLYNKFITYLFWEI